MKKAEKKIQIQKLTAEDLEKVHGSVFHQTTGGTENCTGSNNCACVCG